MLPNIDRFFAVVLFVDLIVLLNRIHVHDALCVTARLIAWTATGVFLVDDSNAYALRATLSLVSWILFPTQFDLLIACCRYDYVPLIGRNLQTLRSEFARMRAQIAGITLTEHLNAHIST